MRLFSLQKESCIKFVNSFHTMEEFRIAFKKHYSHVIAYHLTVLDGEELESIESEGLKVTTTSLLKHKAKKRFINKSDHHKIQEQIVSEIENYFIKNIPSTIDEINFGFDKYFLIEEANHYLIFGPEALLPLASTLSDKFYIPFKDRMKQFGLSYLVAAKVPTDKVLDKWIDTIFGYLKGNFEEASLIYHHDIPPSLIKVKRINKPNNPNF